MPFMLSRKAWNANFKPKTTKIGIHGFDSCLPFSIKRKSVKPPPCWGRRVGRWQLYLKTENFIRCLLDLGSLVNKDVLST